MARVARESQFTPDEIAIVHVVNRSVRRVFLMGEDQFSGKNFDYRKLWIQRRIEQLAAGFAIDVLCFSILSNHVHLVLRQRPDVVGTWSDAEVARRWLLLCPKKRNRDGSPCEPTEPQLNSIRSDRKKLAEIRRRLSDISWWMRLMCQTIAQRINNEDRATGRVWENRYRAIRLLDLAALLACAAYVDLNPIRAAIAETLEHSDFTSVQRRIQALKQQVEANCLSGNLADATLNMQEVAVAQTDGSEFDGQSCAESNINSKAVTINQLTSAAVVSMSGQSTAKPIIQQAEARADRCLAPIHLDELRDAMRILPSDSGYRCSDLGFLNMTEAEYVQLLDWTARSLVPGKRGSTPIDAPPIWQRLGLGLTAEVWLELVNNFGKLFKIVAGKPQIIDNHRGTKRPKRFRLSQQARELLSSV